jgi:hypothetical protein
VMEEAILCRSSPISVGPDKVMQRAK